MEGFEFIKPTYPNTIIRDPISRFPLDKEGELKPMVGQEGIYWRRRIEDSSVIIVNNKKFIDSKDGGKK